MCETKASKDDTLELRFLNDPETGLPHTYGHGVTEDEVRQVLRQPGMNVAAGRNARTIIGPTAAGRHLKVLFVPDLGGRSGFMVTAYELRGKNLAAYHRARRRKSKRR